MNLIFFTSEYFTKDREFRFEDIKKSLHAIANIKANKKKLIFHCNPVEDEYLQSFLNFIGPIDLEIEFFRIDKESVHVYNGTHGPAELTWEHKKWLKWFIDSEYDYFIYWENDMLFEQQHLDFWIENTNILKKFKMKFIPAFIRIEYNYMNTMVSVDCTRPIDCKSRPILELNRRRFVSHPEPYQGVYILDKEDAIEHTMSNKLTRSDYLNNMNGNLKWGICESANQALIVENVPVGWEHRAVIVLDDIQRSLIHHLPNKFARGNAHPFGTIPVGNLIIL